MSFLEDIDPTFSLEEVRDGFTVAIEAYDVPAALYAAARALDKERQWKRDRAAVVRAFLSDSDRSAAARATYEKNMALSLTDEEWKAALNDTRNWHIVLAWADSSFEVTAWDFLPTQSAHGWLKVSKIGRRMNIVSPVALD